jgi:Tfp pilus assembly protein FimV
VAAAPARADLHAKHNHNRARKMANDKADEPPQAHDYRIVTAVEELEEARQQAAKSASTLNHLIERSDSPVQRLRLTVDASMDLSRRARGIASDVDGDTIIEVCAVPNLVSDAVELQDLVEFFLTRSAEKAVV